MLALMAAIGAFICTFYVYFQCWFLSQIHNEDFNELTQGHARAVKMFIVFHCISYI